MKHPHPTIPTYQHNSLFRVFAGARAELPLADHVPAAVLHSPYKMQVPKGLRRLRPFPVLSPQRQSKTMSTPSVEILNSEKAKQNSVTCQKPEHQSLSFPVSHCLTPRIRNPESSRSSNKQGGSPRGGFIFPDPMIKMSQNRRQLRIWLVAGTGNQPGLEK